MSQSEDTLPFNAWNTSYGFWSRPSNGDVNTNELWNLPNATSTSNDIIPATDGEQSDNTQSNPLDTTDKVSPWTPLTSLLQNGDKSSIWSTPDLFYANDKNLSLSETCLPWLPVPTAPAETAVANVCESWDSSHDSLFNVRELGSECGPWKNQVTENTTSNVNSGLLSEYQAPNSTSVSDATTFNPASLFMPRISGSECDTNEKPVDDQVTATAFSTEQLCDHLINSNEGWGKRPVDQTTPWDSSSTTKSSIDSLGRSGITTPTPGSRSAATTSGISLPIPLQTPQLESNVWTSEPPTGTGIWEMHYENATARPTVWQPSAETLTTSCVVNPEAVTSFLNNNGPCVRPRDSTQPNSNPGFDRSQPFRGWNVSDKPWNSGSVTPSGAGRPLLGAAHTNLSNTSEEINWFNNGASFSSFENGVNSWDMVPGNGEKIQWNNSGPNFPSVPPLMYTSDEMRAQHSIQSSRGAIQPPGERMTVRPYSHTYRADLVKYLINQGFKKDDAQAALINCNMEPERALQELRERHSFSRSFNFPASGAFPNPVNNGPQFSNSGLPSAHCLTASNSTNSTLSAMTSNRNNKLTPSGNGGQPLHLSTHPNSQLIRQQLTQQVRSALNLSLPNPLAGPLGGATAGNSLLGQPPPPLLNGAGMVPAPISSGISGTSYSPHSRTSNLSSFGPSVLMHNSPKRSARQMAIVNAMQDLQKKLQSIQQQFIMYRNNPSMCAQPQYSDVITELQGQMQQIEAQLRAKQAQLNIAYAQDTAASSTRANSSDQSVPSVVAFNNPMPPNRMHQDQLVQKFMEMQLRPGNADNNDNDFPSIGMWNPHKHVSDNPDRAGILENDGSMSTGSMRGVRSKPQPLTNWGSEWPTNNNDNAGNQPVNSTPNWPQNFTGGSSRQSGLSDLPQPGQWLLVQPVVGAATVNLNGLYNLVAQFGLVNFHVLNPSTYCVMVRLQSIENAVHLMQSFSDRLTIELITEQEAVVQLRQRNFTPRSEFNSSNQSSSLSNWGPVDQVFSSAPNTGSFGSRKAGPSNGSRLGVMVSGMQ